MAFETMDGLYLLGFLVPLLLLYLIKAKPKFQTIPALLFFSDDKKIKKYNAMLQKLLFRVLFLLQVITILLFALSAAGYIITMPIDAYSLNTVVIVDTSASMHAFELTQSRMDAGKAALLKEVKGQSTLILAGETPLVMATNASASKVKGLISNLAPQDLGTRLDSAVLLANELLGEERANIVIYSDFVLSRDDDLLAAKKLVEANNKRVSFITTGTPKENIGFINLNFNRGRGEAFIRNFGERGEAVDVSFTSDTSTETTRVQVEPNSVERISFELTPGTSIIELKRKDSLRTDDVLYVVNPHGGKISILLIANKPNTELQKALEANPIFSVQVAIPPVIPDFNHDVVIVGEIDKNQLLPNTFRDIKLYKEQGGRVILVAQDNAHELDYQGLLPFRIGQPALGEQQACVDIVNTFTTRLSSGGCFSSVFQHFSISDLDNQSIVLVNTDQGTPLFILSKNLFFYGIHDRFSGFKDQINYPLFWDDLMNSLLGRESLASFNYKTGDIYLFGNQTEKKILDTVGIQTVDNRPIAVNLVNPAESDLSQKAAVLNESLYQAELEKVRLEVNLSKWLLVLASALLIFELFYIKRRGDL